MNLKKSNITTKKRTKGIYFTFNQIFFFFKKKSAIMLSVCLRILLVVKLNIRIFLCQKEDRTYKHQIFRLD